MPANDDLKEGEKTMNKEAQAAIDRICQKDEIRQRKKIGTPRQSRGFFIDGQSPLILAGRVTSRKYGLPIARDCYLLPVNGFRRSPSSVVPRLCPRPTDV